MEKKPRNYIRVLENFLRLLRLEVEKRHARIESASELSTLDQRAKIASSLQRKYGNELTTEFLVNNRICRRNADPRRQRRLGQQRAQSPAASPATTLDTNIMSSILEEIETQIAG